MSKIGGGEIEEELNTYQVEQDLTDPRFILDDEGGDGGVNEGGEVDALLLSCDIEGGQRVSQALSHVEWSYLQL